MTSIDGAHYLGEIGGKRWEDEHGVIIVGTASARRLPVAWVELKRWCIFRPAAQNAGSRMWRGARDWIREVAPGATTVVSYSDPGAGHSGGLYRACGWLWAPTWHRLRPPPSGLGSWDGVTVSGVKDRWVFPLAPDPARAEVLRVRDDGLRRRFPWAEYAEPTWRRGVPHGGGGDWRRWNERG